MKELNREQALLVIETTKVEPISQSKLLQGRYFVTKVSDKYRYIFEFAPKVWRGLTTMSELKEEQRTICFNKVKDRKSGMLMEISVSKLFILAPIGSTYVIDVDDRGYSKFVESMTELAEDVITKVTAEVIEEMAF